MELGESSTMYKRVWLVPVVLLVSLYAVLLLPVMFEEFEVMAWFKNEPRQWHTLLLWLVLTIAAISGWFGRHRMLVTGPSILIFLLLAMIAIPSAMPARNMAHRAACVSNLRAIQNAKSEWARGRETSSAPAAEDLYGTNKYLHHAPTCPSGGRYVIGGMSAKPTCSLAEKGHRLE